MAPDDCEAPTLFDSIERVDPRPARYSEHLYSFLNRVSSPYFGAVRDLLEQWFSRYPAAHQEGLRANFRARDRRSVVSAYWELYLHELHRCLGFEVTVHPEVPGTSTRPDFLVSNEATAFYVEAALVAYSDKEARRRQREALVLDMVNDIKNRDFSLSVDVLAEAPQVPRRKHVISEIDGWLGGLDWEQVRQQLKGIGFDDLRPTPAPSTTISVGGWGLGLTAYPRSGLRGDPDARPIGSPPSRGGLVDDAPVLRDTLRKKMSRYGKPDRPYVIALASMLDFADERDIEQALYGPEEFVVLSTPEDPVAAMALSRKPDGLWQRHSKRRATRVSAVITLLDVAPSSFGGLRPDGVDQPVGCELSRLHLPVRDRRGRRIGEHPGTS